MRARAYVEHDIPFKGVNGQGSMNEHTGDGMVYLYYTGREYDRAVDHPAWDWNRLPGVTEAVGNPVDKCGYSDQLGNDSAKMMFTGTASDGTVGISGMQLVSHGAGVLKSTALLTHAIVGTATITKRPGSKTYTHARGGGGGGSVDAGSDGGGDSGGGGGGGGSNGNAVVTTVESRLVQTDVIVMHGNRTRQTVKYGHELLNGRYDDVSWVWHNNTGYIFPRPLLLPTTPTAATVVISVVAAPSASPTTSRFDMHAGAYMPPLFTIGVDHGGGIPAAAELTAAATAALLQPSTASYIVVPGVVLDVMDTVAANAADVVVVASSKSVHAVHDLKHQQLLAVYWNAGAGGTFTFPGFKQSRASSSFAAAAAAVSRAVKVTSNRGVALIVSPIKVELRSGSNVAGTYNVTIADPTNAAAGGTLHITLQQQQHGASDGGGGSSDAPECAKQVVSIELPKGWSAGQSISAESKCVDSN